MMNYPSAAEAYQKGGEYFHPGFSIDCVIFGFHEGVLKILLNRFRVYDKWMLPGGFVYKEENVDDAAYRILNERTGLKEIFLRQFYLFGDTSRSNDSINEVIAQKIGMHPENDPWIINRFITVGYYALVDSSKVNLSVDENLEEIGWVDLKEVPLLYSDHNQIIEKAIETIRMQLNIIPIGYELLPEKFTMPELRVLYETILGKQLDRRNFQRKMLSMGLITKLEEQRKGGAHRAPDLYCFDVEKYKIAFEKGMNVF